MDSVPEAGDRICFVLAAIGDNESETRKRSDQVLRHVIEPCARECGYRAIRADQIAEPGLITHQVIQHLIEDPLVIADLTERNPNVFYELAVRHALRKPLVQIIRRGEQIPFDVAGMRMVQLDHQDLDSVADAKSEIVKQIRAIERDPANVQSPISAAVNLESLKRSDKPEAQLFTEIAASLSELKAVIGRLVDIPTIRIVGGTGAARLRLLNEQRLPYYDSSSLAAVLRGELEHLWKPARLPLASDQLCHCGSDKPLNECHGAQSETPPN